MKSTIYIFGFITLFFLQSCGSEEEHETKDNRKPITVKTQKVGLKNSDKVYQFTAKVEAESQVNLSTKIMGQITFLNAKEGDKVYQGQTLVQIKSSDIQANSARVDANISEANIQLKNIEKNYQRIKALYDKNSATQKELDDIKTQYDAVKAQINAAKAAKSEVGAILSYATVTAPFSGFVSKKFMEKGSVASPGMPILSIESNGMFKVVAKVPESEIDLFNVGEELKVNIDALNAKLTGRVTQINPSSSFSQYEVSVLLNLDNEPASKIKAGMFAKVFLEKGQQKNILVPTESIVKRGQLRGIYTVNQQGEAMLRWVRLGKVVGDKTEVLSGLQAGEEVIIKAEGKLEDGIKAKRI